eukprot:GHVS01028886.1.p1 GENE.GHVS01028886.1~~GHVS01028886.1.p1  ORF type:complete len:372 (+),score=42.27 GHVS01028886.1:111-1118(+)
MASFIQSLYERYDGFVILHGTDTLAYTAAALSFMLEDLNKPVVITGSMLPLANPRSDAKRNIVVALQVAAGARVREVCVVFGSRLMRGLRVRKMDCGQLDAFSSPNFPCLATVGVEVLLDERITAPKYRPIENAPLRPHTLTKPSSTILSPSSNSLTIFTDFCMNVVTVTLLPGMSVLLLSEVLSLPTRPLAVVLALYGSGTAPQCPQFMDVLKAGLARGVAVVAVTQCVSGSADLSLYENGAKLQAVGVANARDMTPEACVMKLAYLMGKGYEGDALKAMMEDDLRGEITLNSLRLTPRGTPRGTPQGTPQGTNLQRSINSALASANNKRYVQV